jgi:beta-lactamase regulating signal transducer with metallopeptidase domain
MLEIGLSNAVLACVPAALALAVGLTCRRPALVHALWLLVLLKLVTPPLFRVPLPWPAVGAEVESASAVVPATDEQPADLPEMDAALDGEGAGAAELEVGADEAGPGAVEPASVPAADEAVSAEPQAGTLAWPGWSAVLVGGWLAGSLGWFLLAVCRVACFARALRHTQAAPVELAARVAGLAQRMGLRRVPAVRLVPGRLSPMVWGVVRPVLLVPEELRNRVSAAALDTLVVHELAHLRRRDHLVRVLEFLALGLCWWNPLAWFARRELHEAEEQCCDAWVPRALPGAARTYATALVDVLDFLSDGRPAMPPLACGVGQVHDLKRRLTMILRGTTPTGMGSSAALGVLVLAGLLLPLLPGPGRSQDEPTRGPKALGVVVKQREVASDELDRANDELKKKLAEIDLLKKKIMVMKQVEVEKAHRALVEKIAVVRKRQADVATSGHGGVTIRIEISGLSGKSEEITKLVTELEKVLPGKDRKVLVVRGTQVSGRPVVIAGRMAGVKVEPAPKVRPPTPPAPAFPGMPALPGVAPRPGMGGGIHRPADGLEKKVDALLKELEALRRELHQRRGPPGGRTEERRPGAGVAPAPGGLSTP